MFSRNNLKFKDNYSWEVSRGDNPTIKGSPDNDLLNRTEGYEVLYFIQQFMKKQKTRSVKIGTKAEALIINYIPSHIRSRKDIEDWLIENWNKTDEDLYLIGKGYKEVKEFLPEKSVKKLEKILKITKNNRKEFLIKVIDKEYDYLIEG